MAYLKSVPKLTCYTCVKRATVVLYNRFNAELMPYCTPHGKRAEAALSSHERRVNEAPSC